MASDNFGDPQRWLNRARELRALAEETPDDKVRDTMRQLATEYEKLAARTERHRKGTPT